MTEIDLVTPDEVALLRVVMASEQDVRDRWEGWALDADIDHLSVGAYGILPVVYKVLESGGIDHPWIPRLRGTYRRRWVQHQLAVTASDAAAQALRQLGADYLEPVETQINRLQPRNQVFISANPRIIVRWKDAPELVGTLRAQGWALDDQDPVPGRLRRAWASLTRDRWCLVHEHHGTVEIATSLHSVLSSPERGADVWERAEGLDAEPYAASRADLLVATLTDQIGVPHAITWAVSTADLLDRISQRVEIGEVLDRPEARLVLPIVRARLELLQAEGLGTNTASLLDELDLLVERHSIPTGVTPRARATVSRRVRAVALLPGIAADLWDRYGGAAGVIAQLRER